MKEFYLFHQQLEWMKQLLELENTFNGELYGGTVKVTLEAHYTAYVVGENSFNDVLEIRWQYIDGESTNDPVMDMTTFMAEGLGQVKIVDNIYGDISLRTDLTSTAVVDDTTNDTADDTTDDTTVSNEGSESSPVSLTLDTTHSAKIGANPFDGGEGATIGLAAFHTVFNLTNVFALIWFTPWLVKMSIKTVKSKGEDDEIFKLEYIRRNNINTRTFNS